MNLKKEGEATTSEKSNRIKLLLLVIAGVVIMVALFSQMLSSYMERQDAEQQTYSDHKQAAMMYVSEIKELPQSKNNKAFIDLVDKSLQNDEIVDDDEMLIIEVVYKDIKSTQQSADPADAKNHSN